MGRGFVYNACVHDVYTIVTKSSQYVKFLVFSHILNMLHFFIPSFTTFVTGRTAISLVGSIKYVSIIIIIIIIIIVT